MVFKVHSNPITFYDSMKNAKKETQGYVLIFGAAQPPLKDSLVTPPTGDSRVSLPILEARRDEALPSSAASASLLQTVRKGVLKYSKFSKAAPNGSCPWKSEPG